MPYLGEVPWEYTVIVFRDADFNICPMARCKCVKYLQLQNKIWSVSWWRCSCCNLLSRTNKIQRSKVIKRKGLTVTAMMSIGVAPLSAMSLCKCGTVTAFQTTWPQPNNASTISVPLLIHHLGILSYTHCIFYRFFFFYMSDSLHLNAQPPTKPFRATSELLAAPKLNC